MSRSICLMGPPGSGKSTMVAKTAVARPVHFIDIDRKVRSCDLVGPDVTVWELAETLAEDSLSERLRALVDNRKPKSAPMGWVKFAQMVDELPKRDESMKAGSWCIDSFTRLVDHLKRQILYLDAKGASNLSPRNYGALLGMLEETTSQVIDIAKAHGKDLIITVHERVSEIPGPGTKVINVRNAQGDIEREFLGNMEIKITPSIEGQFSQKMLSYFDEAYGLYVDASGSTPVWKCRVMPDGRRDLRSAIPHGGRMEYAPDFREIWKGQTTNITQEGQNAKDTRQPVGPAKRS